LEKYVFGWLGASRGWTEWRALAARRFFGVGKRIVWAFEAGCVPVVSILRIVTTGTPPAFFGRKRFLGLGF